MSLHRFDLDDSAQEANDAKDAKALRPASLLTDLLFWLFTIVGTALVIYVVLFLGFAAATHLQAGR